MNTDDELEQATRALRLRFDGASSRRDETEQLVVTRAARRQRRWHSLRWLLPAAAVLVGSSAWAARAPIATRVSEMWAWLAREPSQALPAEVGPRASATIRAEAPPVREPAPPVVVSSTAEPAASAIALPAPRPSASLRKASVAPADGDALYREAHRLHFVERDSAGALLAWERYLALAPHGEFTLEARYNRALCLYRLGRNAEAIDAFTPFARGDFGAYRQEEAQRAIAKLR